jgi:hypothetical protein
VTGVRLYLAGDEPDFEAVIKAFSAAFVVLTDVQKSVLGRQSDQLRWSVAGLRDGSAVVELEPVASPWIDDSSIQNIVKAYTNGLRELAVHPERQPASFDRETVRDARELAKAAGLGGLQGFAAVAANDHDFRPPSGPLLIAPPAEVIAEDSESAGRQFPPHFTTLTGRVDELNRHDPERRTARLWEDIHDSRVILMYPSEMHDLLLAALEERAGGTRRVEARGEVITGPSGRPTRMLVHDLRVLPKPSELPTLSSIIGSMPDLTEGKGSLAWLRERRASGTVDG